MHANCPRLSRKVVILALLMSVGFLFAGNAMNCASFGMEAALSGVDFCFLLDCQNGAFGGLVDPCGAGGDVFIRETGDTDPSFGLPAIADCL